MANIITQKNIKYLMKLISNYQNIFGIAMPNFDGKTSQLINAVAKQVKTQNRKLGANRRTGNTLQEQRAQQQIVKQLQRIIDTNESIEIAQAKAQAKAEAKAQTQSIAQAKAEARAQAKNDKLANQIADMREQRSLRISKRRTNELSKEAFKRMQEERDNYKKLYEKMQEQAALLQKTLYEERRNRKALDKIDAESRKAEEKRRKELDKENNKEIKRMERNARRREKYKLQKQARLMEEAHARTLQHNKNMLNNVIEVDPTKSVTGVLTDSTPESSFPTTEYGLLDMEFRNLVIKGYEHLKTQLTLFGMKPTRDLVDIKGKSISNRDFPRYIQTNTEIWSLLEQIKEFSTQHLSKQGFQIFKGSFSGWEEDSLNLASGRDFENSMESSLQQKIGDINTGVELKDMFKDIINELRRYVEGDKYEEAEKKV